MDVINWPEIRTVFLDMDGTLLDLHFDNYFWREYVPERYAELHAISVEQARDILFPRFQSVEGTMDWYCVDYWSQELQLDIAELKRDIKHLIRIRPNTIEFLDFLRQAGHRLVLVTNAHSKSLTLKMEMTQLQGHFDNLICSHDFGVPKEDTTFWDKLMDVEPFDPQSTLMVDDSLSVLDSAHGWGIKHILAIAWPDSKGEKREITRYPAIHCFSEIMPEGSAKDSR